MWANPPRCGCCPQTFRLVTAGRMACSAGQWVDSTPGGLTQEREQGGALATKVFQQPPVGRMGGPFRGQPVESASSVGVDGAAVAQRLQAERVMEGWPSIRPVYCVPMAGGAAQFGAPVQETGPDSFGVPLG